jgi:hypothetical protein
MSNDRSQLGQTAPLLIGCLILLGFIGARLLCPENVAQPAKAPLKVAAKPLPIPIPLKKDIVNVPVKMSINGEMTIALSSREIGSVKWAAAIEYSAANYKDSLLDSDQITVANAIQDDLAKRSSSQLATDLPNIRKSVLSKLPKTVKSIQLEPSKELLTGFRNEKLRSVPIVVPTFQAN